MEDTTKESQPQVEVEKTVEKTQETTPKITKEKKEKDPKRVAQGKKLAAISKQAKERKARERLQAEIDANSWDYGMLFGFLGVATAIGVVLFYQIGDKKEVEKLKEPKEPKEPKEQEKPKEKKKSLETLD